VNHPTLNVEKHAGRLVLVADYGDAQITLARFVSAAAADAYVAAVAHAMLYARECGRLGIA
jgi:hypothetical protein